MIINQNQINRINQINLPKGNLSYMRYFTLLAKRFVNKQPNIPNTPPPKRSPLTIPMYSTVTAGVVWIVSLAFYEPKHN